MDTTRNLSYLILIEEVSRCHDLKRLENINREFLVGIKMMKYPFENWYHNNWGKTRMKLTDEEREKKKLFWVILRSNF